MPAASRSLITIGALVGLFGVHVDDLIGEGNMSNKFLEMKAQIQNNQKEQYIIFHQSHFLHKMKPMTLLEHRKKIPQNALFRRRLYCAIF